MRLQSVVFAVRKHDVWCSCVVAGTAILKQDLKEYTKTAAIEAKHPLVALLALQTTQLLK